MLSSKVSCRPFGAASARNSNGSTAGSSRAAVMVRGLKENVQALPSIAGIKQVVLQPLGHTVPNQEGKKASVAIYAHLAHKYGGSLTQAAAQEGLSLYDEIVADAKAHRGSHPNIDILLDVLQKPDLQISIQVDKQ